MGWSKRVGSVCVSHGGEAELLVRATDGGGWAFIPSIPPKHKSLPLYPTFLCEAPASHPEQVTPLACPCRSPAASGGSIPFPEDEIVSMADSSTTIDDIEGELFRIERIREILVRRESELRYMMDDIQLCQEISRLKTELQKLLALPENQKSKEEKQREEELVQQIHKLVETRDFLVDDGTAAAPEEGQQTSAPYMTKTGLTLLKECCGFTCSIM
uniref:BMERB domain-containing protein n=1 Tax=Cyanoderma ruficeps TaxID=181631 RepID=A0A8C3NTA6_9PASS